MEGIEPERRGEGEGVSKMHCSGVYKTEKAAMKLSQYMFLLTFILRPLFNSSTQQRNIRYMRVLLHVHFFKACCFSIDEFGEGREGGGGEGG